VNEDKTQNQDLAFPQPVIGGEGAAADAAVVGSICLTLNAAGNILSSDRQSVDFLGYDWTVLMGQPIAVLVHLQDQARLYTELTEALCPSANPVQATLQPLYTSQFCLVCKDGRCLEVQAIGHILQGETTLMRLECLPLKTRSPLASQLIPSQLIPSQLSDRAAVLSSTGLSPATTLKVRQSRYPTLTRSRNFGSGAIPGVDRFDSRLDRLPAPDDGSLNPSPIATDAEADLPTAADTPLFSSVFNAIDAAIFVVDVLENGEFCYVALNPAHERWTGMRSADMIGKTPAQILPPAEAAAVKQHYSDCVRLGMTLSYEAYLPFATDSTWWLTTLTPLRQSDSRIYRLIGTSTNITHRKQVAEELQQQIERQRLISTIAQRIRASLDLNTILNSTVEEVRQFLQTDRVLIYRFEPDWSGKIIVESVAAPWTAVLGSSFQDPCFTANHIDRYRQGRIQVVADIYAAGLNQCHIDLLASLQVRANLVVPIVSQDLWGLLIAQHCREPRQWETLTIELLKQLATQVGIAVHQAELHNQVQRLNTHLEFQVKERTAQLQQALDFEAVLRRITEKVRDSLDESQILQAATQELAQVLQIHRCEVELYNPLHTTVTIAYAYVENGATEALGIENAAIASRPIADYPEIYTPLLEGQTMQFVEALSGNLELATVTRLACPICDDQGILGNLWLERSRGEYFDDFEIQLVEQVADQCAIAMRQARLYEAAQTQVEALEKFISLKDEFLASVSHELCTPMSSIHLAAQTLEKLLTEAGGSATQNPIVGRTLAILKEECQREMRVINNLLTLSYADGEERLAPTLIDFSAWLPQIAEPFRPLAAHRQQDFQMTIAEDLPLLELDLVYLERIINELLNNACKYTPATGAIAIAVIGLPTELQISVTNSSAPMSHEALTHLFEKFYRVPDSSVWEYGGAGLGLAVVKKLVERLQAQIEVTTADRQITFRLRFPIRA
jgi:PAS domain S-box-containing protein